MSRRLDQEREERLQPKRMESTAKKLTELGYNVGELSGDCLIIAHPDFQPVKLWPYSGWWSGKGIGSGRGFSKLLKELDKRKARNE